MGQVAIRRAGVHGVAGCCALLLALLAAPHSARAHGGAPAVLAIVDVDAAGRAAALRLNEGLVVRDGEGMRYVCPAAFGGEDTPLAQPLGDGTLLVASLAGLHVLDGDEVRVREVATENEITAALLRDDAGPLLLRFSAHAARLTRERPEGSTPLWSEAAPWASATRVGERVHLARLDADQLRSLLLSGDGVELERASAPAPAGLAAVFARSDGVRPLLLLLLDGGLVTALGLLDGGAFRELSRVTGTIYGPATDGGSSLVAVNGALRRLDGDVLDEPLGDPAHGWTCVGAIAGRLYGCDAEGASWLAPDGTATPAFEFTELLPPRLPGLPEEVQANCELQWQRFVVDLLGAGIELPMRDAGIDDASVGTDAMASSGPDASAGTGRDAGAGPEASQDGCGCRVARRTTPPVGLPLVAGLAVLLRVRQMRRTRRRDASAARRPRRVACNGGPCGHTRGRGAGPPQTPSDYHPPC